MTPTKRSTVLGITLLLVASTLGQTEKKNKALSSSDETPPGSAGHHGSVQSGQFLLTNNENYGLQISHTPYSSNPSEEELPKAQKLRQQQYQNQNQNVVPGGGETFCAGCTSLSNPQQDEQYYDNNNAQQQPQNAYAVPVQQKQQRYQRPPQQVPYSTGHNSNIGNGIRQDQQQQPGYSYSVNLEGPSGQRDSSWGWNSNWNQQQQQQPQAQVRTSQPAMQQYQWGQRIQPTQQQKPQVRGGWQPPQQHHQYHRELTAAPAVQQHLKINDDGQYSFGYNAADSSRQEQRGLDGTVSGSYAYTDGSGQQVQVDYRASPDQGYQAFGPSIPNPAPVAQFQVPAVPQDTPEVQAARAQFFEAYNQQLRFIEEAKLRALEAQQTAASNKSDTVVAVHATGKENKNTTTPSSSEDQDATTTNQPNKQQLSSTDFKNLPEPIAIPDKNGVNPGPENQEDDELENDAVVIGREDEEPSSVPAAVKVPPKTVTPPKQQPNQDAPPQAGYSFSVLVGDQGGANNYGGYNQNQQWPQWGSQYQYQQQPFTVGYQYPAPQEQNNAAIMAPAPVDSSYQFSHMVGVPQPQSLGYHPQQQSQQYQKSQQQQQQYQISVPNQANTVSGNTQSNTDQSSNQVGGDDKTRSTQPGYFYYVSVGGSPHYMTSNNDMFTSKFPTSLKAHLAGSIPMDARHDPQVPHQNMGMVQNQVGTKANPPVYVDMDTSPGYQGYTSNSNNVGSGAQKQQSLAIVGFIPGAFVSVRNGGFVSVNSAAVAQNGGTRVRFGNTPSNDQNGNNEGHQFPLLIFNNQNQ